MPDAAPLRCPACGGEAYVCDRPRHGAATWAIHCRSKPYHNQFGQSDCEPPAFVLAEWASTIPVSLPDGSDTTPPSGKWPHITGSTDDH